MGSPHLCLVGVPLLVLRAGAPLIQKPLFGTSAQKYVHGNLAVAQNRAEEELKRYSGHDPRRATEFRLLDAEILGLEGRSRDSLLLLTDTSATYPVTGDLAIKRKMLCSLAHVHLGQPQLADQELKEARELSESGHSSLLGEVVQVDGILEVRRQNSLRRPADSFRASLQIARQQKTSFWRPAICSTWAGWRCRPNTLTNRLIGSMRLPRLHGRSRRA